MQNTVANKDFWKGKKVLVTGADGFIGSHLTERLVELGAEVRAFVYYNSQGSWGWLDTVSDRVRSQLEVIPGDIRDAGRVDESCRNREYVFHLASLIAIPYSYSAPESYLDTNIRGALNVAQAARKNEVTRVLHTSTSEVYGTAQYVPIDEKHPLQGQSPYSASKIGADMLMESFYRSFQMPLSIVRPFNTYGPRQSARAIIPTIISQLLAGANKLTLGSLTPTRDLNYVTDTCEGFLKIAECQQALGKTINVGSGSDISIGDLASLIMRLTGKVVEIECSQERVRPKESEVERLLCSAKLCESLTGWKPQVDLESGIRKTILWIQDHLGKFKGGYQL